MEEKKNIFPLAALTQSLERFIRDNFAHKNFWVIAEITKAQEKNGHHYLELADSKDGKRIAEMSANMWFSAYSRANEKLNGDLPKIFKSGNKVLINVRIEYHVIFGLKLNIVDVDPSITFGEIEKKKKETIERLKKEKLFGLQNDLHLPAVIKRIALIGSPNTSGYRDFMSELTGNNIFTNFKVKSFPVRVQGDNAAKEIVEAIKQAQLYDVEVIAIVRGGGSKMDLNLFNDYEIARSIAESKLPVLTGIGHETDEVVADLVAKEPQITPTAVAKFLYIRAGIFKSDVRTAFDQIMKLSLGMMSAYKDEFNHMGKYLVHYTQSLLKDGNNEIRDLVRRLQLGGIESIENERSQIKLLLNKASASALGAISLKKSVDLIAPLDKIDLLASSLIDKNRIKVSNLEELLGLLNPEELLKKGYTISTIDNKDLSELENVSEEMILKTLSDKFLVTSKISEVKKIAN